MAESNTTSNNVITIILVLALAILKVENIEPFASWSWWWIFCPIWIPIIIGLLVITVLILTKPRK